MLTIHQSFDLIMCLKEADKAMLQIVIQNINLHIHPKHIIIIAPQSLRDFCKGLSQSFDLTHHKSCHADNYIIFLNENEVYDGLNLQSIKEILESRIQNTSRAGWYLQQFLKMAYAHYVINATSLDSKIRLGGGAKRARF